MEELKEGIKSEFITKQEFQGLPAGTHIFLIAACAAAGYALFELPVKYGLYALLPVDLVG